MKSRMQARIFSIIYICLCFFITASPVSAQAPMKSIENTGSNMMGIPMADKLTTGEFTAEELAVFQTSGYVLRTHLPYEAYNRIILGKISPLNIGFGEDVHFEAHNDLHGRFSVFVRQLDTFRSIDGQRILDVQCCSDLYKKNLTSQKNDFTDGFKKTFHLPKLDKTIDGTFNDVMNVYVFPDY